MYVNMGASLMYATHLSYFILFVTILEVLYILKAMLKNNSNIKNDKSSYNILSYEYPLTVSILTFTN